VFDVHQVTDATLKLWAYGEETSAQQYYCCLES